MYDELIHRKAQIEASDLHKDNLNHNKIDAFIVKYLL